MGGPSDPTPRTGFIDHIGIGVPDLPAAQAVTTTV